MSQSYLQSEIRNYILLGIQRKTFVTDHKLPSENQLAIKFSTTSQTISKVLKELVSAQILYTKKRQGYFVSGHNFLNPDDFFGLKDNLEYDNKSKEVAYTLSVNEISHFEHLTKSKLPELKFVEKTTYHHKKLVKVAYIGIIKQTYEFYTNFLNGEIKQRTIFGLMNYPITMRHDLLVFEQNHPKLDSHELVIYSVTKCQDSWVEFSISFIDYRYLAFSKEIKVG